jgi:HrpA-like RNA helicase
LHFNRKGIKKYSLVRKQSNSIITLSEAKINLNEKSKNLIKNLLNLYELSSKEKQELLPRIQSKESKINFAHCVTSYYYFNISLGTQKVAAHHLSRLNVPPSRNQSYLDSTRLNLPIYLCKDEILGLISLNRVVLITGLPGSGKSTQVSQFLLDNHNSTKQTCRIVQLVSTDLAVLNISSRVAIERGEEVGQTVGYKLKYQINMSNETALVLSTYDEFLGSLDATLVGSLTYIILVRP